MEKGRNNAILLTVVGIATLLVTIAGATFAFFTARLTDGNQTSTVTIQAADTGVLGFNGGALITVENIYPRGARGTNTVEGEEVLKPGSEIMEADSASNVWATKGFYVTYTNKSAYAYQYKLVLHYDSTFGTEQLHYVFKNADGHCSDNKEITSTGCNAVNGATWAPNGDNDNTTGVIAQKAGWLDTTDGYAPITLGVGTFPAKGASAVTRTHNYALTISYPDTGVNQNYAGLTKPNTNQEKVLNAYITIEEVNAENTGN